MTVNMIKCRATNLLLGVTRMFPRIFASVLLVVVSIGCASRPGTYGYAGEGDKGIVDVLRRNHMNSPKGIEKSLRAELYRGRDPANGLTADYLERRGVQCVELPVVKCSLKGEANLNHTMLPSGSTQGPYQKTTLLIEIYLSEQPQRMVVTRTDIFSTEPTSPLPEKE